jgi:hypothetical protein
MERLEIRESVESVIPALLGLESDLRFASSHLATATLVVLLLCATRQGLAQTPAASGTMARSNTTTALVSNAGTDAAQVPTAVDASMIRRARELDALLAVRGGGAGSRAKQTDAAIAAAVARGELKGLKKKDPFRKQSNDLFRTQRALQVGNQEMVVRLRLRAKKRDAMAVELRF